MDCNLGVHSLLISKVALKAHYRAFTLIETLVVVSLIGLLIAITAAAASAITSEARREQTRAMMEGLLAANDEHKAVREASISHSGLFNGDTLSSTERFVASCQQIQTCEDIMLTALNSSGADTFRRTFRDNNGNGRNSVYDRWGTELEYRQRNDPTGSVVDGPDNENGDAVTNAELPLSRDPFFASAGPDMSWGTDDDITTVDQ